MIKILGLGPGNKEALTIGAVEVIKNSEHIYLRTIKHPTVDYINSLGVQYKSYDEKYEIAENFDEVYNSIVKDLLSEYDKYGDIVYAVPGHPLVAEKSVKILLDEAARLSIDTEVLPAVSFIDALMGSLNIDPVEGLKIIDAFEIKNNVLDKRCGTIITQVYDRLIASEVKLALQEYYGDDTAIYFVRAAGIKELESIRQIPLYELDRQTDIDYLTSIYIPKDIHYAMDFYDLLGIMDKLRSSEGCPWDREQTHESLKKYLIEESYEVIEAIEEKDDNMLIEELGDVLLQVVFHAQLGKEEGFFNINDVIAAVCDKMIERHPHVFGDKKLDTSEQVLDSWDKIKKKEQGLITYTDELRHVAKSLPSLIRAEKVQKKAAKVGFDWDRVECAMDKVLEEFNEVKDVYKGNNRARILEEVGDLLFATVNVSRFLDIDPELALKYTIEKFINRFEYIEKVAAVDGKSLGNMSLEEMDLLWERAKTL